MAVSCGVDTDAGAEATERAKTAAVGDEKGGQKIRAAQAQTRIGYRCGRDLLGTRVSKDHGW